MTKDAVVRMAEAAGFPARRAFSDLSDLYPRLERFAALVAAAERKNYEHTLSLQQQSYEREIQLEIEAEREACIDDCNVEARDDGTAQRIIERIRARSNP